MDLPAHLIFPIKLDSPWITNDGSRSFSTFDTSCLFPSGLIESFQISNSRTSPAMHSNVRISPLPVFRIKYNEICEIRQRRSSEDTRRARSVRECFVYNFGPVQDSQSLWLFFFFNSKPTKSCSKELSILWKSIKTDDKDPNKKSRCKQFFSCLQRK